MKKIMILNGAGRRNGNTAELIKAFTEGAQSVGNEVREFYLQTMNIHGCIDCQGCARANADANNPCVQKDDMAQIYEAYLWCDVIVFASPIYWFTITGTLKTAVDRLYAIQRKLGLDHSSRETALILTAGGDDFSQPIEWYSKFEKWMKWKNWGIVTATGKSYYNPDGKNPPEKVEEARKLGASIH